MTEAKRKPQYPSPYPGAEKAFKPNGLKLFAEKMAVIYVRLIFSLGDFSQKKEVFQNIEVSRKS